MDAAELYNRGLDKVTAEAYASAIRDFNEVVQLAPDTVDLYYHRGFAHYKLGEYRAAIDDFSKVLRRDSHQVSAASEGLMLSSYLHRGLSHRLLQNYQEAFADFADVIQIDRQNARVYQERSFLYIELDNKLAALKDLQTAARLSKAQGNMAAYQEAQNLIEVMF